MIGEQLPLSVQLRDTAELELFHAGPNAGALAAVRDALAGRAPRRVLLHGAAGSGRSHLLQGAVRAAARSGRRCGYLSFESDPGPPEILDGFAAFELVAFDDLDPVLTRRDWAIALAHLLDGLQTANAAVLLAASRPPEHLDVVLPDLRTRLAASAVFALRPLDDADRRALLQQRAHARGLDLGDGVADFLVLRLPRDGASLMQALDLLDRASLSAQRRLTLPFVQAVLAQAGTGAQAADSAAVGPDDGPR